MIFYEMMDAIQEQIRPFLPKTEKQRFRENQMSLRRSIREMQRRFAQAERKEDRLIQDTRAEIRRQTRLRDGKLDAVQIRMKARQLKGIMKEKQTVSHFISNLEGLEQQMLQCQTSAQLSECTRATARMMASIQDILDPKRGQMALRTLEELGTKANMFNEMAEETTQTLQDNAWSEEDASVLGNSEESWETDNSDVNRVISGLIQEAGVGVPFDALLPSVPSGRAPGPPPAHPMVRETPERSMPTQPTQEEEEQDLAARLERLRSS